MLPIGLELIVFRDDAAGVSSGRGRVRLFHPRNRQHLAGVLLCVPLIVFPAGGCGPAALPPGARISRELVFAHDDNRGTANLTFPNLTYESILRFELPAGKHRALRLRLMAEAAGTIAITFYENSPLECPGDEVGVITRELLKDDLSNGKDGRWAVEDLSSLPPLETVVWVGLRKVGGTPSLWTSSVVSGQVYLRDRDPSHGLGLLPVKRTPMVRLEVLP